MLRNPNKQIRDIFEKDKVQMLTGKERAFFREDILGVRVILVNWRKCKKRMCRRMVKGDEC